MTIRRPLAALSVFIGILASSTAISSGRKRAIRITSCRAVLLASWIWKYKPMQGGTENSSK